jgi:penicillin-binding protein activator
MNRNVTSSRFGWIAGAMACAAFVAAGCQSDNAHYVDSNGPNTVVSVNQINVQDWNNAGALMVQSLLGSGVIDSAPHQHNPAVMGISRITNKTDENVDVDLLTKNIRVALNQSGKVVTNTTVGNHAEDPMARDAKNMDEFYSGNNRNQPDVPDYFLSGKILQTSARAGDVRQVTYTFQLSLTDHSGNAIWEDQKQITKQGKHSSVGW